MTKIRYRYNKKPRKPNTKRKFSLNIPHINIPKFANLTLAQFVTIFNKEQTPSVPVPVPVDNLIIDATGDNLLITAATTDVLLLS